jgi:hypothetical protein
MKNVITLLALAGLTLPIGLAVADEGTPKTTKTRPAHPRPAPAEPAPPPRPFAPPALPPSTEEDEVAVELVAILDKTESVDTFVVTLETLAAIRPDYRRAVPAAIRNADRLGLLKGVVTNGRLSKAQEAVLDVLQAYGENGRPGGSNGPSAISAIAGAPCGAAAGGAIGSGVGALVGNAIDRGR